MVPMAIAVIGGLITSTGLTLVIVPAAFSVIDDIERWLGPKVRTGFARAASAGSSALTASCGRVGNVDRGFVRHES